MAKELIAGVSFSDDTAQTVVLEIRPDGIELYHIDEFHNAAQNEIWFMDSALHVRSGFFRKISNVSVALDNAAVVLHSFPLDSSLTQPEKNEHIQWELSNFIEGFKFSNYINDIHVLKTQAREQISEIMTVSVSRSRVFAIQQALIDRKRDLKLVDTNYFCAQSALFATHPETKLKVLSLAEVTKNRVDAGIVINGRLVSYRYAFVSAIDEVVGFLENFLEENTSSELFLYGTAISSELTEGISSILGISVTVLNPFQKIRIPSSFRGFDKFIGHEHRFASCIGAALRK